MRKRKIPEMTLLEAEMLNLPKARVQKHTDKEEAKVSKNDITVQQGADVVLQDVDEPTSDIKSKDDHSSKSENHDASIEPENKKTGTKNSKKTPNAVTVPAKELYDLTKQTAMLLKKRSRAPLDEHFFKTISTRTRLRPSTIMKA